MVSVVVVISPLLTIPVVFATPETVKLLPTYKVVPTLAAPVVLSVVVVISPLLTMPVVFATPETVKLPPTLAAPEVVRVSVESPPVTFAPPVAVNAPRHLLRL